MAVGVRAEFRGGGCTLMVLGDWSLQFTNEDRSYGPIRDVDLLPKVPAIVEALGVKPKEVLGLLIEYRGWARPRLKPLSFEEEELRVTFNEDEGLRVPASQLYFRYRDSLLVGELTYAHAQVVKISSNLGGKEKVKSYEAVEPLLIWTCSKDEVNPDRLAKPLRMIRRLEVDGRPIHLELKSQYAGTLETLMSLQAVRGFLDGTEPPTWTLAFTAVRSCLERFVSFPWDPRLYDVISCWVLGTYFA
ncbi:MAG: hypothetical protein QW639_06795 [Candidatus Bathyarchaeia archaeon]